MRATLYKLKEGYVLCSDEELPVGYRGSMLFTKGGFLTETTGIHLAGLFRRVLTQSPDFSLLSEEDAKRIGWFDVEKLGYDRAVERMWHPNSMETRRVGNEIIKAVEYGFQKALELTADRRFTEEDIRKAFEAGREFQLGEEREWRGGAENEKPTKSQYVDSLSQPKSWEVEYEEVDGVYKVVEIIKPQLLQ